MGSSSQNKTLFDEVRSLHVAATPEEIVRQQLLKKMIHELGYPKELLAVEKELKEMVHLKGSSHFIPQRRADIVCFAKGIHPHHALYPLLLVECKKEALDKLALDQLLGYNHLVGAYFMALANDRGVQCGYIDGPSKEARFSPFLPTYSQLIEAVRHAL